MSTEKPLTKSDLISALKEAGVITKFNFSSALKESGVITKSNVASALEKANVVTKSNLDIALKKQEERIIERVFNDRTEFYHGMIKPEFNKIHSEINTLCKQTGSEFKKVDQRLNKLESGQSYIKNEINGLTAELSDTPSRSEFTKLRTTVDHYHPAN